MGGINFFHKKNNQGKRIVNINAYGHTIIGKKQKIEFSDQDSYSIIKLCDDVFFYGIFDGHGEKGSEASRKVKVLIENSLISDANVLHVKLTSTEKVKKYFEVLFNSIQSEFEEKKTDYEQSGTCAICILFLNSTAYCVNLGDSRAVLGSEREGKLIASDLSLDHKPGRDSERNRILENGGRVLSQHGGILRVYKKNEYSPGLAVSRSLGDLMAHECGVCSIPEITCIKVELEDNFIIAGSDGVWDIMGSSEVVGYIFDKLSRQQCEVENIARMLVEECRLRWELFSLYKEKVISDCIKLKVDDSFTYDIDDITAVIFFPWKNL